MNVQEEYDSAPAWKKLLIDELLKEETKTAILCFQQDDKAIVATSSVTSFLAMDFMMTTLTWLKQEFGRGFLSGVRNGISTLERSQ